MPGVNYAQRFYAILDLLRMETDEDHGLDARQISTLLKENKGIVIDPRSIRKTITEMKNAGFPIDAKHKYYYRGVLSSGEIEFLTSSVRYAQGLTNEQRSLLVEKLAALGDRRIHTSTSSPNRIGNDNMLDTLSLLREAMAEGLQVAFHYGSLALDGCLAPKTRRGFSGKPKVYNANPYDIVSANGRMYLIASVNKHTDLSHYRIDRIIDVRKRRIPIRCLPQPLDVEAYVLQHPYMYSGNVIQYRLRVKCSHLNDVFDWFGKDVIFENSDSVWTEALVLSDAVSMDYWIRRYAEHAQLIDKITVNRGQEYHG